MLTCVSLQIGRPLDRPLDGRADDQSVERSIGRWVHRSIGRSFDRSLDRSINRSLARSRAYFVDGHCKDYVQVSDFVFWVPHFKSRHVFKFRFMFCLNYDRTASSISLCRLASGDTAAAMFILRSSGTRTSFRPSEYFSDMKHKVEVRRAYNFQRVTKELEARLLSCAV